MRYLFLLIPLLAFFALACDDDGGGQQAATATPPVAPATTEPTDVAASPMPEAFDSFRDFAPQIEAALEGRDVAFFIDAAVLSPYTCTDQVLEFPLCQGHEPGDKVEGFWAGYAPGHGEELLELAV